MSKIEYIEIKVGNSKRLMIKDNILQEANLNVHEIRKNKTIKTISDIAIISLLFLAIGKEVGTLALINKGVNTIAGFFK